MKKVSIIALCNLIIANCGEAAKMCTNTNISTALTQGDSWQTKDNLNMFGIGCRSKDTTWGVDMTGQSCIGRCTYSATTPCATLILASTYRITPGRENEQGVKPDNCQCRLVYPFVGEWVTSGYISTLIGECQLKCTNVLQHEAYRNLLLGL